MRLSLDFRSRGWTSGAGANRQRKRMLTDFSSCEEIRSCSRILWTVCRTANGSSPSSACFFADWDVRLLARLLTVQMKCFSSELWSPLKGSVSPLPISSLKPSSIPIPIPNTPTKRVWLCDTHASLVAATGVLLSTARNLRGQIECNRFFVNHRDFGVNCCRETSGHCSSFGSVIASQTAPESTSHHSRRPSSGATHRI